MKILTNQYGLSLYLSSNRSPAIWYGETPSPHPNLFFLPIFSKGLGVYTTDSVLRVSSLSFLNQSHHLKPNYSHLLAPIIIPFSWTPKLKLESHIGHLPFPSATHPFSNTSDIPQSISVTIFSISTDSCPITVQLPIASHFLLTLIKLSTHYLAADCSDGI